MLINLLLSLLGLFIFIGATAQIQGLIQAPDQRRVLINQSLEVIRSNVLQTLRARDSWSALLTSNGPLVCVTRTLTNTPDPAIPVCVNGAAGTFRLRLQSGEAWSTESINGQLFGEDGRRCEAGASEEQCPLRLKLFWRIDCDTPCTDPMVYVRGEFSFNGGFIERIVLNLNRNNFEFLAGPDADNPWMMCASRNTLYLPAGYRDFLPDRRGCVDSNALAGKMGEPGPVGPPGELTLLTRRHPVAHCSGGKYAPNFSGNFLENIESERLKGGLSLRLYPSVGHCTGVALQIVVKGVKGTEIHIPCRPANGTSNCFSFGGANYFDVKHIGNPQFYILPEDVQELIDKKEDVAGVYYDWGYNSGGPWSTCFGSVYNKASYGFMMVLSSNFDSHVDLSKCSWWQTNSVLDPSYFNQD